MKNWISFLLVLGTCISVTAQETDMASRVQEELERDQLRPGEKRERLVALGPDAVPALCDHIETYKFPGVIFDVLTIRMDVRATPAILKFMENRKSAWSDRYEDSLNVHALRTLREIGDSRAEALLMDIASGESTTVKLRFAANTALARIGPPNAKAQAWNEIMRIYRTGENVANRSPTRHEHITFATLYSGLVEVLTDEVDELLASFLRAGAEGRITRDLLYQLKLREETRDREKIVEALLYVAERDFADNYERGITAGDEFLTQALAFKVLFELKAAPPEKLATIADSWIEFIETLQEESGADPSENESVKELLELREEFFTKYPQFRKAAKAEGTK